LTFLRGFLQKISVDSLFATVAASAVAVAATALLDADDNNKLQPHFRISAASRPKSEIAVVLELSKNRKAKHPFLQKS